MSKQYGKKFWIAFWAVAILLLSAWYLYLEAKNNHVATIVNGALSFIPLDGQQKKELGAVANLADYFMKKDGKERTFLVLFQNNMEIRPGGGFIGAFGIVKIKDGQIISNETHDLSNFDARIPDGITPPYPMKETLRVDSWKLRDSNYAPDFATNAQKAEDFYHLGNGQEQFDGVIGITSNVLTSMLKVTGPIQLAGYPGTYDENNAIISLEYQVEKAFEDQGIDRGDRKSVMSDLAKEIQSRVFSFSTKQKIELAKVFLEDLNRKDIQLYFKDEELQKSMEASRWAGQFDRNWNKDYLMAVDANLGAFKSDYYVKRQMEYTLDLQGETPKAKLAITYEHTAKQKDWMTKDYLSYLRVYVPEGSWLTTSNNFSGAKFGSEFGKKYFGAIIKVPLGTSKTVEINYDLPKNILDNYDLKIQKQSGLNNVPVTVHVIYPGGEKDSFSTLLNQDIVLSDFLNK
jgi:hypothetical protein